MPRKLTAVEAKRALKLRRQCWTQDQIAEDLGCCRESVNRFLSRIDKRLWERLQAHREAEAARQVEQLGWVAQEASRAWERSKEPAETIHESTVTSPPEKEGGEPRTKTKSDTILKGQAGDPRLLAEVRGALADQRKILGLDAPPAKAPPTSESDFDQAVAEMAAESESFEPDQRPNTEPEGSDQASPPGLPD